jgi:uncharacterized protein YbjT (DUF2867 family)
MGKTALLFGSTGLIGNLLLEELLASDSYTKVRIFVRQPTEVTEAKVEEIIMDFAHPEQYSPLISGDDIYICLGTTIRKAGSVANMEKIDRDIPVKIAEIASTNRVRSLAVVSSIGANKASSNYYLRIKGEMEEEILRMEFENIAVVRPSMLLGERNERRAGELVGKVVMTAFSPLLAGKLKKFRAIHSRDVARAMIEITSKGTGKMIYESDQLRVIAGQYNLGQDSTKK